MIFKNQCIINYCCFIINVYVYKKSMYGYSDLFNNIVVIATDSRLERSLEQ